MSGTDIVTDAITSNQQESAGASAASTGANDSSQALSAQGSAEAASKTVSEIIQDKIDGADSKASGKKAASAAAATPIVDPAAPVIPPAFTPNFKYKVAGQEKELDKFWQSFVKDADSEKKIKDVLTKVDAFEFIKGKKDHFENQYNTLSGDYEAMSSTVNRFDQSVKGGDLSSAFRIAGIPKEQVFKWVHQQLQFEGLPPEQKAQIEAAENARSQQFDLEDKFSRMEKQYQTQAVQARTMQLDMALMKPEVAAIASAWDQNAEAGFTFRDTVAQEARRVYYESGQDLSPEQAVAMVMNRFGRFVGSGAQSDNTQLAQSTVVTGKSSSPPPVIPNVSGKAASPIKKVAKSLDDIRAIERAMPG